MNFIMYKNDCQINDVAISNKPSEIVLSVHSTEIKMILYAVISVCIMHNFVYIMFMDSWDSFIFFIVHLGRLFVMYIVHVQQQHINLNAPNGTRPEKKWKNEWWWITNYIDTLMLLPIPFSTHVYCLQT